MEPEVAKNQNRSTQTSGHSLSGDIRCGIAWALCIELQGASLFYKSLYTIYNHTMISNYHLSNTLNYDGIPLPWVTVLITDESNIQI